MTCLNLTIKIVGTNELNNINWSIPAQWWALHTT